MHYSPSFIYTLLTLAPLATRADLQLDAEDISTACSAICRPVRELSQTCDADGDLVGGQPTEDNLTLQCLCLNDSFDVSSITALCASCIQQNPTPDDDDDDGVDDDTEDINEIMSRCGFSSTSYAAAQSTSADGVTVAAVRPTAATQLTTTVTGGAGGAVATGTGTAATTGTRTTLTTGTGTATTTPTGTGVVTTAGAAGVEPFMSAWNFVVAVGLVVAGAWAL